MKLGDWLGEVGVPAAPGVDGFGVGEAEAVGDLFGADEVCWVHEVGHARTVRQGPAQLVVD